jgi:two-component system response regulator RegX3
MTMLTGRPLPAAAQNAGHVLLVEDDHAIAGLVRSYLERYGYTVIWVSNGEDALVELPRHPIRIVVLDIGLPGMDGFDVCREVRSRSNVPVIMLTARDEEADRIVGFELGADDYVPKPFSPRELAARIKAILRRSEQRPESEELALGRVHVRRDAREVRVDERVVELTAKEFDLLVSLIENTGIVLSRERLLDEVWGFTYPGGTRTVDVHVAQLRRKLGTPELIRTVRGAGYKAVEG